MACLAMGIGKQKTSLSRPFASTITLAGAPTCEHQKVLVRILRELSEIVLEARCGFRMLRFASCMTTIMIALVIHRPIPVIRAI